MTCLLMFVSPQILRLGGIAYFLSRLMDPPSNEAVLLSIKHLMELVNLFCFSVNSNLDLEYLSKAS